MSRRTQRWKHWQLTEWGRGGCKTTRTAAILFAHKCRTQLIGRKQDTSANEDRHLRSGMIVVRMIPTSTKLQRTVHTDIVVNFLDLFAHGDRLLYTVLKFSLVSVNTIMIFHETTGRIELVFTRRLPSTHGILRCVIKNSGISRIRTLSLFRTLDLNNVATARRSSQRVVNLVRQKWTFIVINCRLTVVGGTGLTAHATVDQSVMYFSVAGPTIWNSLPDNVISAPSLSTFRQRLKTFLFQASVSDIIINPW